MKRQLKLDQKEITLHAAGLGAALTYQYTEAAQEVQHKIADMFGGHVGIMEEAALTAREIEEWRMKNYPNEHFNDEVLPFYYELWDEIARVMWEGWVNDRRRLGGTADILNGMMLKGAKK